MATFRVKARFSFYYFQFLVKRTKDCFRKNAKKNNF